MPSQMFASPVGISVGLGFRHEISSIDEMYQFLTEWAPSRRGPLHANAVRAAMAARSDIVTVDQAERAFRAFAVGAGIFWEETRISAAVAAAAFVNGPKGHVH